MTSLPKNTNARLDAELRDHEQLRDADCAPNRDLQLLCAIAHSLVDLGVKLNELTTLAQQQNDLLRRIIGRIERVP